jgi:predicted lipid-binding transport protein (Tim44 family)
MLEVHMVNKRDLRGGIEKMREVAQLLNGWADDMERSLEAEKKKKPAAAADAAPAAEIAPAAEAATAEPASAPAPSADAVRAELAAKCAAGFRTQVQALINSYGAAKFSEVAPEHYPALLEAVACLRMGGEDHAG